MPTLYREAGLEFLFRAADGPEPPHVHVRGNGGKAKLWLRRDVEVAFLAGYDQSMERRIMRIARRHRVDWLAAWHGFFGHR